MGYSVEDQAALKEKFRPVANAYRARNVWLLLPFSAGLIALIATRFVFDVRSLWLTLLPAFILLLAVPMMLILPKLICPGCGKNTERGFGTHCPTCGKEALKPGNIVKAVSCDACGERKSVGRFTRRYSICYCTFCGLKLDDSGL